MKKNKWINNFIRFFKLPDNTTITFYRNPNEFKSFKFERINPDHKGIIWGQHKDKKVHHSFMQVGKVFLPSMFLWFKKIDRFFEYIFSNPLIALWCLYSLIAIIILMTMCKIPSLEVLLFSKR